jgi:hypothetical protein
MRGSVAVLKDTSVKLWDLAFPRSHVLMHRTRVPYVHLDGLIAFSKRDRDGKVDAYLAAFLPDEVARAEGDEPVDVDVGDPRADEQRLAAGEDEFPEPDAGVAEQRAGGPHR